MDKIYVVFWTQSGNTQAMAQAVAEGITAAGKTPELVFVSEIPADALKDEAAFALGCPAMGAEVLEESEMEPFVMAVETFAKGKDVYKRQEISFPYQLCQGRANSRNAIRLLQMLGYEEALIQRAEKRASDFIEQGEWSK